MVISMMLGDRNDEMEMREIGATVEMLRTHDEHENSSANSKNSVAPVQEEEVAELVTVPQNLSFYTMVYKMTIETRKKTKTMKKNEKKKMHLTVKCERIDTCMMPSSSSSKCVKTPILRRKNEENNTHSLNSYIYTHIHTHTHTQTHARERAQEKNATEKRKYDEKQEYRKKKEKMGVKKNSFFFSLSVSFSFSLLFLLRRLHLLCLTSLFTSINFDQIRSK